MSNFDQSTPYAHLTPEIILAAIESLGLQCTGSLLALNSYENRVYQLGMEGTEPLIAKFYRPMRWSDEAILEEHQFAHELNEHEIPVVAPIILNNTTLHHFNDYRFAIYPRRGGRALEIGNLEHLEWMGRFIGRLHAVGACRSFKHRSTLNVETLGFQSFNFLLENNFIPEFLIVNFSQTVDSLLNTISAEFAQVKTIPNIRLHGDCHPGNVLWRDEGPHIVDLDDCMMGPAVQDIWMLVSGEKAQMRSQLDRILNGYYEFHDFDPRELRLIESLRALRILHYAAWLGKRWNDPTFPIHFPLFNTINYWQDLIRILADQHTKLLDKE